jgi:opacity protein-like surface antigen
MKKFLTLLAALLVVFTFTINVEAEVKEKGFYLGGGVAYAWENFDDGRSSFHDAWGLNAFAGYRLMRYIAFEGNFNWYDDITLDSYDADLQIWTLMLDVKAMYPVYYDRLVPYLGAGAGYMDKEASAGSFDSSDSDAAINLGGGLDFYVTSQFSLGLDGKYVWGTGDLEAIEYFVGTINVAFHF